MNNECTTAIENISNFEMANRLTSLEPYLNRAKGRFGYGVARNVRKLKEACSEYLQTRVNLFQEYGEPMKDENGEPTGQLGIKTDSEGFQKFKAQMEDIGAIKHAVEIFKVPYELLPDDMTANDMLALEWMLLDVSLS